jgi:hypothetical protein
MLVSLLTVVVILSVALAAETALLAWFFYRAGKIQADLLDRLMARNFNEYAARKAVVAPRAYRPHLDDAAMAKLEQERKKVPANA